MPWKWQGNGAGDTQRATRSIHKSQGSKRTIVLGCVQGWWGSWGQQGNEGGDLQKARLAEEDGAVEALVSSVPEQEGVPPEKAVESSRWDRLLRLRPFDYMPSVIVQLC